METAEATISLVVGAIGLTNAVLAFVKMHETQLRQWPETAPSTVLRLTRWPVRAALRLTSLGLIRWVVPATRPVMFFSLGVAAAAFVLGIFLLVGSRDDGPPVRIISLSEGDVVQMEISVEIEARPESDAQFLCVFVRPRPGDPNQDYWPQEFPQPIGGDRWEASPVYVGVPEERPGTSFKICAVLTPSCPSRQERQRDLPDGPSDCVLVTRQ